MCMNMTVRVCGSHQLFLEELQCFLIDGLCLKNELQKDTHLSNGIRMVDDDGKKTHKQNI